MRFEEISLMDIWEQVIMDFGGGRKWRMHEALGFNKLWESMETRKKVACEKHL